MNIDGSGDDFAYSPNGEVVQDNRKGISNITYNYLGLPVTYETGTETDQYIAMIRH